MATAAKVQKDKPHGPRLAPRQTAASVARAAHNATNRNLNSSPNQRTSPTRTPLSPSNLKNKSIPQRSIQKCDSKSEASRPPPESVVPDVPVLTKSEADTYIIDNNICNVIAEEVSNVSAYDELGDSSSIPTETLDSPQDKEPDENVEPDNPDSETKSRPETPFHSRPQTPKSLQSSRPQTPRLSSRPPTPGQNGSQRKLTTTPTSRPNTPQRSSPHGRLNAPSALPVPTGSYQSRAPDPTRTHVKEEDDVKAIFTVKQRQFHRLKKELDIKQQTTLEVYSCLINLYDRMNREGDAIPEAAQIQELKVFNVRDWTAEEVAQLCRDVVSPSINNEAAVEFIGNLKEIDENILSELDGEVSKVPSKFAELCLQAFTARQELIDWVKELIEQVEDGRGESMERISRFNTQGLNLCEELRRLKSQADGTVNTVSQLSRKACRERTALIAVGESLVREIARLRQDLEARAVIVNEMREIRAENECAKALEETRRQLEEERAARANAKDKLATTESQLRQTRARVSKLDQQLREAETSISNLTSTVKTLEDRCRQREVQFEARARKLKETLKTGEVASNQICQQRDALQIQIQDLKEQIETINAQNKITVQELNNEIKDLSTALDEQRSNYQKESELRKSLEKDLEDCQQMIGDLKTKNAELESSRPNPELPTEREMDLWSELQATKDTLRLTEDEVTACKLEKVRFLETLKKISETENKVGMQQKLAGELLSKEEIIGKMQIQIRELTKNMKLNEQKVIQYEQYVRTLQAHNRAVANCQEAPNGISYQDLQQEIMTLRMNLLESMHRNEEMSEVLAQKEQQLEQQDKTSRAQARVIKVREELINMLKNKETEQSRELSALQQDLENRMKIVDEVNKQIAAKADEIQELFATLENKQQQIHRLEKIVLALEEQQKRAQAQRTRHEEKIATLEHELAAAGNRRERKFIFF